VAAHSSNHRARLPRGQGKLTCEADRKVIAELRETATSSRAFTLGNACKGLFCTGVGTALVWGVCCCGWLGLAALLNARRLRPGASTIYRLTPTANAFDTSALVALAASMRAIAADRARADDADGDDVNEDEVSLLGAGAGGGGGEGSDGDAPGGAASVAAGAATPTGATKTSSSAAAREATIQAASGVPAPPEGERADDSLSA